jgi:large subunit ribosomal protein L23
MKKLGYDESGCVANVAPLYRNTEKSTGARDDLNKHYFNVSLRANKSDVKKALTFIFGEGKIDSVNIMRKKGKKVIFKGKKGRKSDMKIAIVTLKSGENLGEALSI